MGWSDSSSGRGVYGYSSAITGTTYGVYGWSKSSSGRGVYGYASATSGQTLGVYGKTDSSSDGARGVLGWATAITGVTEGVRGQTASNTDSARGVWGYASATSGATYGVYGSTNSTAGRGVLGYASNTSGANYGVYGNSASSSGVGVYGTSSVTGVVGIATHSGSGPAYGGYFMARNAWEGIGVYGEGGKYGVYGTSPGGFFGGYFEGFIADLVLGGTDGILLADQYSASDLSLHSNNDVNIHLDRNNDGAGVFNVYDSTDSDYLRWEENGNLTTTGHVYAHTSTHIGDLAEPMPLSDDSLETGDVVVLDPKTPGSLRRSTQPYDPLVAGVLSGPDQASVILASRPDGSTDRPLALAGRVSVKVSAENGSICVGDLLTTSATPGHAMKAEAVTVQGVDIYPTGTIIGKALGSLDSGTGVIEMLITLQ